MPADPRVAGAKGGRSKSPAKIAAARRNGFQKVKDVAPSIEDINAAIAAFPAEERERSNKPVLVALRDQQKA